MKRYIIIALACSVFFGCKNKHSESWLYDTDSKSLTGLTIHSFVRKENEKTTSEMYLVAPSEWKNISSRETATTNVVKLKNPNKQEEIVLVLKPINNTITMNTDTSPSDISLQKTGENRWILVTSPHPH